MVPERRRRGAARHGHQPRRRAARDRAHELRRDRARAARRRPRASRVRQPVRRDRVARLVYRHHRHPPPALRARSGALWCVHVVDAGQRAGRARSPARPTARASSAAGRTHARPGRRWRPTAPLSGTTGAVLDPIFALRTRVRLEPGPVRVGGVHHARRRHAASARSSWPTATTIRTPRSARSTSPGPRAQVELRELGITPGDAARVPGARRPPVLRQPGAARAAGRSCARNRGSQPLLWAARRLGRLADRAGHDRLGGRAAHAAPAARRAPLLAPPRA